jgi:uncharacterized Ntn-hydrolase superfamily protein
MVRTAKSEDESRRRILDRLQAAQQADWQTHQDAITVVQTTKDQRYNERLKNLIAAKQRDTVRWTCVRIDRSESTKMPKSRTAVDGSMETEPNETMQVHWFY